MWVHVFAQRRVRPREEQAPSMSFPETSLCFAWGQAELLGPLKLSVGSILGLYWDNGNYYNGVI